MLTYFDLKEPTFGQIIINKKLLLNNVKNVKIPYKFRNNYSKNQ